MKRFGIIGMIAAVLLLGGCAFTNPVKDGTAALEEGNYEEALSCFQSALDEDKDREEWGEAYLGIGMVRYEQQDYAAAEEAFRNALSNDGTATPVLYNMMAVCNMQQEQYEEALSNLLLGIKQVESLQSDLQSDGEEDSMENTDYSNVLQEMKYNEIVCYEKCLNWEMAKTRIAEYVAKYPEDEKAQKEAQFLETR